MLHGFWGRSPVESDSDFRLIYLDIGRQLPISCADKFVTGLHFSDYGVNRHLGSSNRYARNSTTPVSRLYIEPTIFMLPTDSRSRSTELFSRMLAIVSDTFFRATASTNA